MPLSCVRSLLVITSLAMAVAACGRQGPLEPPAGVAPQAMSGPAAPPAPGSGGPIGPRPFIGPGADTDASPQVRVVGKPVTKPLPPSQPFLLDPLVN
jgi:predicted small lipoprotein YifL